MLKPSLLRASWKPLLKPDGLPLPGRDHRAVRAMLGSQLSECQVAPDPFALKSAP